MEHDFEARNPSDMQLETRLRRLEGECTALAVRLNGMKNRQKAISVRVTLLTLSVLFLGAAGVAAVLPRILQMWPF